MFSNGLFSLGLIGPLIYLFLGFVVIGLSFGAGAIAVRWRETPEPTSRVPQLRIDLSAVILAISALLPIIAVFLYHGGFQREGIITPFLGMFLLWPVSAVFAISGKGAGRKLLLVAHGLIALWVFAFLMIMAIYVYRSRLKLQQDGWITSHPRWITSSHTSFRLSPQVAETD